MDFSPNTTHESKTAPGVSFVVRRVGPVLRATLELKCSKPRAELREIAIRLSEADDALYRLVKAAGMDNDGKPLVESNPSLVTPEMIQASNERARLTEERALYETANVKQEWITGVLESISGITVAGQQMTVQQVPLFAPPELFDEIYDAVIGAAYLKAEPAKNSQSSTTSSGTVEDPNPSTAAAPV